MAVVKLLVALVRPDQRVLEACTREAVVLLVILQEAVGDTTGELVEDVVVVGVPAILRAMSFSIYRVFMLEMEMSPSWLSNLIHRLNHQVGMSRNAYS